MCLPWQELRNPLLALRAPRSWLKALGLAVATLLVAGLVISIIDSFLHGGREQGVVPKHFLHGHAGEYAANWVVIAGVAPFVEETTYRGLGFSLFLARSALWAAIFGSGIVFATSHGLVHALPELAIFGFALAWLRSRVDSVFPGMLVHCAFNSFALASVVLALDGLVVVVLELRLGLGLARPRPRPRRSPRPRRGRGSA